MGRWIDVRPLAVLAVLALGSARAAAAPIAEGYELSDDHGVLSVSRGKRHAELERHIGAYMLGERTYDKATRRVTVPIETSCNGRLTTTYTLDQLEARLVNVDALAKHRKADWAASATGFAQAVTLDPTWRLPAYNLASARAEQKDLAAAVTALAPWLASEPIATYVQVAQDPELQPLLARPELAAIRATKAGTIQVTPAGVVGTYAYAPERGLVAAQISNGDGGSCAAYISVMWFDAKTGARLATLALSHTDPNDCSGHARPIEVAPHRADAIARILDDLGFAATPFEEATTMMNEAGHKVVRLPRSGLGVVPSQTGEMQILRKDRVLVTAHTGEHAIGFAAYLGDLKLAILGTRRESDECDASAVDAVPVP